MQASNLPPAGDGCSDALNAAAVIGPASVWQCLSASCQLMTAQPGVFSHAASHIATVAESWPNGAELWSASFSFATAGPATCVPRWHSQAIPAGVGAGGEGGEGGNGPGPGWGEGGEGGGPGRV